MDCGCAGITLLDGGERESPGACLAVIGRSSRASKIHQLPLQSEGLFLAPQVLLQNASYSNA